MKKKILLYLCCLSSVLTLTACQNDTVEQNNKSAEAVNTENTKNQSENETVIEDETLQSKIEIATYGCEVVQEGETVSLGPISITVNDVNVTRKKGNWHDFLEPKLDAEGNLPEDQAYVIVNTTITQNGEKDFWLNSIDLCFFLDNDLRIGAIEIDGTTLLKKDNKAKNSFQGLIKDGDTVTTDLVYIINQEEETNDSHFLLAYNPTGCSFEYLDYTGSEEYCVVYLESLENVWDADNLN